MAAFEAARFNHSRTSPRGENCGCKVILSGASEKQLCREDSTVGLPGSFNPCTVNSSLRDKCLSAPRHAQKSACRGARTGRRPGPGTLDADTDSAPVFELTHYRRGGGYVNIFLWLSDLELGSLAYKDGHLLMQQGTAIRVAQLDIVSTGSKRELLGLFNTVSKAAIHID
jgi:hypothetical protein